MPTYVNLMKLTDQGIKSIKEFPQRLEAGRKGIEAMGGKMVGFYAVLGEYDYVAIAEMPAMKRACSSSWGWVPWAT